MEKAELEILRLALASMMGNAKSLNKLSTIRGTATGVSLTIKLINLENAVDEAMDALFEYLKEA